MKKVRMKYTISGGRADGSQWPAAGEELSCLAAEAAELVAAGIAENAETSGAADEGSSTPAAAAPEPAKDASVYPPREQPRPAAKK